MIEWFNSSFNHFVIHSFFGDASQNKWDHIANSKLFRNEFDRENVHASFWFAIIHDQRNKE